MKPNWQQIRISDVAAVQSGAGFPDRHQGQVGREIPFYKVSDMNIAGNEREMFKENNSITEEARRQLGAFLFPSGSTIFPKIGGAIATNKKRLTVRPCCVDNNVMGVVPQDGKIDGIFLFYFFLKHDLSEFANEAHLPSIKKTVVESWPIALPASLQEQRRIVAILDEAFEGIATAKANAEKNLLNTRELFKSQRDVLLSAQAGWHEAALAELCSIKHGYAFEGEFFASEGDHVLLTPGSFFESGGYRERGEKTKYFTGPIPRDYVLNEGDLLVAMTEQAAGLLGSPLLVPESSRFLHNQRLGLVEGKAGVPWLNEFFFHVFNLGQVRQAVHASASGVKVRHTSPSKIGAVFVAYPGTVDEQRAVAAQLVKLSAECERLINVFERKLAALNELKKSLLHQAFTGQLTSSKPARAAQPATLQTTSPEFTANVIAIAYARHERQMREKSFGRVKEQKTLHLVEAIAKIDLGRQPMRDAAGPNDFQHMLKAEAWAKANGFFEMVPHDGRYEFKKLSAFKERLATARQVLAPYLPQLDSVIDLLVAMGKTDAEVFATVHAAWNNLLIEGVAVTDDAIVSAAREGWHADKLEIPEHRFRSAIELIRQKGLVPNGTAKYVGGQQPLL